MRLIFVKVGRKIFRCEAVDESFPYDARPDLLILLYSVGVAFLDVILNRPDTVQQLWSKRKE